MGRDVLLLYMSPKNPNYKTQTNEGAVRYLIKEKETPDCILALCSETVRKKAVVEMPDGSTCTTLEYFRDALRRVGIPEERLVVIEVPDSMDDEKKQFQAISQLLEKINEGDTLSIDLSGGMRDTAMLLVTAARCMRDLRKVETRRVIYAELRFAPQFHTLGGLSRMTAPSCMICSTLLPPWTSSSPLAPRKN